MSAKARLDRLDERLTPRPPDAGLLNVFYVAVAPGEPTGVTAAVWGGVGREVRYAAGTAVPLIPGGPHKLFRGPALRGVNRPRKPSQNLANPLNSTLRRSESP